MCVVSVMMQARESTKAELMPRAENAAATILLESRSPNESTASVLRGVISPTAAMPRNNSSSALKSPSSSAWKRVNSPVPSSSLAAL